MFWESCARARGRLVAGYLAALGVAVAVVTWPQRDPAIWALKFYNAGLHALELQQWPAARKQLELAHAYAPGSTEINLGVRQPLAGAAESAFGRGTLPCSLSADSRHKAALSNLGVVALEKRDWAAAATYLTSALQIAPDEAKIHFLLAKAKLGSGDYHTAALEVERAIALNPAAAGISRFA